MDKDYFDYRSDLKFLKEFEKHFKKYHAINLLVMKGAKLSAEEEKRHMIVSEYINVHCNRVSEMGLFLSTNSYRSVNWRNPYDVHSTSDERLTIYYVHLDMLKQLYGQYKHRENNARKNGFYHAINRILDVPFKLLKSVLGYDIRKNEVYRKWMSWIVMGALALLLTNQFHELVEWGVSLYAKIK